VPRVLFQANEVVSNFLKVGSGVNLELFKHGTSVTDSGNLTTIIPVSERRGFENGDHLYVGLSESVTISDATLPTTGAGNITVSTDISFSDGDAVIRKRDVSVSSTTDDYAAVYDSEDLDTELDQPIPLDSSNQAEISVTSQSYALRYSDSDDASIYTSYKNVYRQDMTRYAKRYATGGTGTSSDPWVGWQDVFAINSHMHFEYGYYKETDVSFSVSTATGKMLITGDGEDNTFILAAADSPALKITSTGGSPSTTLTISIRDISFLPSVTNTGSILRLENLDSGSQLRNIGIAPNANTVATGLYLLNCNDVSFQNLHILGTTTKYFSTGVLVTTDEATERGHLSFYSPNLANCTAGVDLTVTLGAYRGISFYDPKMVVTGTAYGTFGIRAVAAHDEITIVNPLFQKYTQPIFCTGVQSFNAIGGNFTDCRNAGLTDGAAIELVDCTAGSIISPQITTAFDGIVMSGTTSGIIIHDPIFTSIANSNVIDTSTGTLGNTRIRGGHIFSTKIGTFTSLDTTPTIAGGMTFKTANAGGTSITTLDDGIIGQRVTILINDANTTFVNGTFKLQGAVNYAATTGEAINFVYDGTNWWETSRDSATVGTITTTGNLSVMGDLTVSGQTNLSGAATVTGTISGGIVTYTSGYMNIIGEGSVADNLDTITSGATGDIMIFRPGGAYAITLRNAGNITLPLAASSFVLGTGTAAGNINCECMLVCDGGNWKFLAASINAT